MDLNKYDTHKKKRAEDQLIVEHSPLLSFNIETLGFFWRQIFIDYSCQSSTYDRSYPKQP